MRLKNFNISLGSQIFKACSEEPRLRILNLIMHNREMCISDLELILSYTQTKTSRHISYLKNAGILKTRKADQWTMYSIKDETLDIIQMIFGFMQKDATLKSDIEVFSTMYSNRELAVNTIKIEQPQNI